MFELLHRNLDFLLTAKKLTSKDLSDATRIPLPTINRLRSDPDTNPTLGSLTPICQFFNVTLGQLVGLESLSLNNVDENTIQKLNTVPILSWQSVPQFIENTHPNIPEVIYTELQNTASMYALKIDANNWPIFEYNSIIFIARDKLPENGDYVVVYSTNDKLVGIKQFITDIDGIYLKSLNADTPSIKLTKQYKIAGVIIQVKRNLIRDDA